MTRLQGRVACITGAARGVGRSIAMAFANEGADLLLVDICRDLDLCPYPMATYDQLEDTASRCREAGSRVIAAVCDVRDQRDVDRSVQLALGELGRIDVLVNNAGIVGPGGKPAHALTEDEWLLVVDVDLNGPWRCAKAVLPQMVRRRSGVIVNIASTGGLVGFREFSSYVAAKHGLIGLTRALAVDYAPHSIRVNCVCPTSVVDEPQLDSGMLHGVAAMYGVSLDAYEETSRQLHPLDTLVAARDVAAACVWLASDEARRVTGASIVVDAGFSVR